MYNTMLRAVLLTVGFSLAGLCAAPNLVFIIADDCTYTDLGVYGGQANTPHLDKLAREGMQFTRCFQAAPMCSPTRHNIYTGLYPVKSGAYPNHTCVYPGTKSAGHYLKAQGYRVALSGKTHIAPRASFPFEYSSAKNNPDMHVIDTLMSQSNAAATPFCLFACSNEPHDPFTKGDASAYPPASLTLPPTWVDTPLTRKTYAAYLAEITYFDQQCGDILALLDKHSLADKTLVMVVSEQGSIFPFAKWTCYEQGLASGMIVRWPGQVAAGSKTDALVEYVDILPTFLEAAAAPLPDGLDGRSFMPVLTGKASAHKTYTYGLHTTCGIIHGSPAYGIRSAATATHRYIRNLHHEEPFSNIVMGGKKDLSFWNEWEANAEAGDAHAKTRVDAYRFRPAEELFDVQADPHCLTNLIDQPSLASIKADLSARLDAWMADQGDQGDATERRAKERSATANKSAKQPKQ